MILRIVLVLVAAAGLTLGGCRKEPPPAEPQQVEITPENLDTELDKMEAEIEAEIAAEE